MQDAGEIRYGRASGPDRSTRSDDADPSVLHRPLTMAVRRALIHLNDAASRADLLFLERWEIRPMPGLAAALRVSQLRRANPALVAEIRAELNRARAAEVVPVRIVARAGSG
ncbi:protein of unknown function [Rhodovastum atsumiense]|nr:protein of unknown function [Rhodovastum atsumiense]